MEKLGLNGMWTKYTTCDLPLMWHRLTEMCLLVIRAYCSQMCNWNKVFDLTHRRHIC